ncbi:hypothetical protein C882_4523 [Caenispirillum salinarum AK4]|uniref:Extensin-like C-terminal domain-containing protein n=1 Tax=Caenispirillum salinarum AK4 TaxID=1238182 RepID=K9H0J8_9PROT|nr:extensin family protein [Caenispirillum salinarum]EKV30564.1 hypothetical protein C882_4523 [Caenispirillum salinarum AK4]
MPCLPRPFLLAAALVLTLGLASCGGGRPAAPPAPTAVSGLPTEGPACVVNLVAANVAFDRVTDFRNQRGCGITTAVSLYEGAAVPLNRPVKVSCGLAAAVLAWETQVLHPLAQRVVGQPLVKVHHVGGYVCRGRTSDRSRLSEHAHGRAIDVIAFEFADGRIARVAEHWDDRGPLGRFLREASQGACGVFQVVLSPNADAAHRDHLHLDVGPWKLCQG